MFKITKKHIAIFLTAVSFILAQFIVEFVAAYLVVNFWKGADFYFYKMFVYVAIIHVFISLILVIWARHFALRFYSEK